MRRGFTGLQRGDHLASTPAGGRGLRRVAADSACSPHVHRSASHMIETSTQSEPVRFALLTHRSSATNLGLATSAPPWARCVLVEPARARDSLDDGDAVVGRLDVRPSLDGIEDGLTQLQLLETRGLT